MDINDDAYCKYGKEIVEQNSEIARKIRVHIGPAVKTLGKGEKRLEKYKIIYFCRQFYISRARGYI
jgi:hypothetical protein